MQDICSVMQKRGQRGRLTRERIVAAALAVADRDSLGALTIRSVAAFVGAPPMSLYTHVSSKEELINLMHCEVSRLIYEGEQQSTWQNELLALCLRTRRTLLEHPRWLPLCLRRNAPIFTLPARDRLLAMMVSDGMSLQEAFRTLMSVMTTAVAHAMVQVETEGPDSEPILATRIEQTRKALAGVSEETLTSTEKAVLNLRGFDADHAFEFIARALIAGIRTPHE
jgi:AcrR family transcriptional regulator